MTLFEFVTQIQNERENARVFACSWERSVIVFIKYFAWVI